MKKVITFTTAALAAAVMCSTATAGTVQAAGHVRTTGNVQVKVVSKENYQDWKEQLQEWNVSKDCLKWGTILWKGDCPQLPENQPEEKPETPTELTFTEQVVALVNVERAKEGLKELSIDEDMESAALVRAKEIQTSFSHTRPDGSSFSTALKEADVTYRRAGENIAWGQKTPEEVVEAWMNSAGHRANILNKNYSRIGVGHLQNAKGTSYWVQLFAD